VDARRRIRSIERGPARRTARHAGLDSTPDKSRSVSHG
jgi:hypothetical protein